MELVDDERLRHVEGAKGRPPKSALIFMSNDAVGLVVQKQLPEHAKTLSLEVPFSQPSRWD